MHVGERERDESDDEMPYVFSYTQVTQLYVFFSYF